MQILHAQLRKANWPRGPGDRNVRKTNKLAAEAGVREGQQFSNSFTDPPELPCAADAKRLRSLSEAERHFVSIKIGGVFANAGREEKA
jgi:hypothetical protein